jgi:CelD/BcsL family acetyltransferase involved in cellulose biosynthesis/Tfp pilus assembly protein PilF
MMRVEVIEDFAKLRDVRANWDSIYDADPEAHFFLSWPWIYRWFELISYPTLILAVRPDGESSDYVAFLPLWIKTKERKTGGLYHVIHLGGNHFADYTGLVCRPDLEEQAIGALTEYLKTMHWAQLHLQDIRVSERRLALLMKGFRKKDFDTEHTTSEVQDGIDLYICPSAKLTNDFDSYLDTKLSANTRQKLRRLLRQLDSSKDLRITHADASTIERDIDILLRFWTDRWGRQKGDRLAGILENNRNMLRHVFDHGSLLLPILWQGDKPAGALGIFLDNSKKMCLFFVGGRDATFKGPSSGLVLHAHSIRHVIQNGFTAYDFLRGNEAYKYSFGVDDHLIKTVVFKTKDKQNLGSRLDARCLPVVTRRTVQNFRNGAYEKAEVACRQILEVEPQNADALYVLGRILAERGAEEEAMALHKTLLAAAPESYKPCFVLGRSLLKRGERAEAASAYADGFEREPKQAEAYFDLSRTLLYLGLFELAIATLDVAAELEPDFPDLHTTRVKAVKSRDKQSVEALAQVTAATAGFSERIGRIKAIAKAVDRNRPKSAAPLVLEWSQPKGPDRPFTLSRNAMPMAGAAKSTQKG